MNKINDLLRKVIPIIMDQPEMMDGYDISWKELTYIIEKKKLPLEVFLHVGGDNAFFFANAKKLGITMREAQKLKNYFQNLEPEKEINYLKRLFTCIELNMNVT